MGVDPLLGVGREPQASGRISIYDTGTINEDLSVGSTETRTISLNPAERVVGVYVSIWRNTAGGVPLGSLEGCKFSAFVNEQPIGSYSLPSSNEWSTGINDFIPANIELWGTGNVLKVQTGATSGSSYNIFYRVQVYTIAI